MQDWRLKSTFNKKILHSSGPLRPLRSKKIQKMLILSFEANLGQAVHAVSLNNNFFGFLPTMPNAHLISDMYAWYLKEKLWCYVWPTPPFYTFFECIHFLISIKVLFCSKYFWIILSYYIIIKYKNDTYNFKIYHQFFIT